MRAWLFEETEAYYIGLFRFFYCALTALGILEYSGGYDIFFRLVVLPSGPSATFLNFETFQILRSFLIVALIFGSFGFLTRISLACSWILFSIYEYPICVQMHPYSTNLTFFALMALTFGPGVTAVSVDNFLKTGRLFSESRVSAWILRSVQIFLVMTYLSAAFSKLSLSPFGWFNGEIMRSHMLENYLFTTSLPAQFLLSSPVLLQLCGILTIAFEILFVLTLFSRRAKWVLLPAGLVFHLLIFYVLRINFFWFFFPAYLAFIDKTWARDSKPL